LEIGRAEPIRQKVFIERRTTMGLFDWMKGSGGKQALLEEPPEAVAPAPVARPTTAETREKLWHVRSGNEVRALVDGLTEEEALALVAAIDVNEIPLNAFCTQNFKFNDVDDRMVATSFVALRLLERNRKEALEPLLEKLAGKFGEKVQRGPAAGGPSFSSADVWRIGESLMLQTHTLAIELLKKGKYDQIAGTMLEALLADYPARLESHFWFAATRHNLYMQNKNPETKERALQAIDGFVAAAKDHADSRDKVAMFEKMRREEY
jgi:hypothetical protein